MPKKIPKPLDLQINYAEAANLIEKARAGNERTKPADFANAVADQDTKRFWRRKPAERRAQPTDRARWKRHLHRASDAG